MLECSRLFIPIFKIKSAISLSWRVFFHFILNALSSMLDHASIWYQCISKVIAFIQANVHFVHYGCNRRYRFIFQHFPHGSKKQQKKKCVCCDPLARDEKEIRVNADNGNTIWSKIQIYIEISKLKKIWTYSVTNPRKFAGRKSISDFRIYFRFWIGIVEHVRHLYT